MMNKTPQLYWHLHHEKLVEPLREGTTLEERLRYIEDSKDKTERALRLKLIKKVILPKGSPILKAYNEYREAANAHDKIHDKEGKDCTSALDKVKATEVIWYNIITNNSPELIKLHKQQCKNCPWDGNSILTRTYKSGPKKGYYY